MSYENVIHLFLSLFRFFAFVLAVLLIQAIPLDSPREPTLQTYVILGFPGLDELET